MLKSVKGPVETSSSAFGNPASFHWTYASGAAAGARPRPTVLPACPNEPPQEYQRTQGYHNEHFQGLNYGLG
jgi:hypothetical protein